MYSLRSVPKSIDCGRKTCAHFEVCLSYHFHVPLVRMQNIWLLNAVSGFQRTDEIIHIGLWLDVAHMTIALSTNRGMRMLNLNPHANVLVSSPSSSSSSNTKQRWIISLDLSDCWLKFIVEVSTALQLQVQTERWPPFLATTVCVRQRETSQIDYIYSILLLFFVFFHLILLFGFA